MGLAMAPATDAIMGSLPLAKASVGSAVNDTTRTTGGALGVAVLGSLLSSGYRGDMDAPSPGCRRRGRRRAGLARRRAGRGRTAAASRRLATAAQDAFVSGMHTAALVAAGVALVGALVALALPAGAREAAAAGGGRGASWCAA